MKLIKRLKKIWMALCNFDDLIIFNRKAQYGNSCILSASIADDPEAISKAKGMLLASLEETIPVAQMKMGKVDYNVSHDKRMDVKRVMITFTPTDVLKRLVMS